MKKKSMLILTNLLLVLTVVCVACVSMFLPQNDESVSAFVPVYKGNSEKNVSIMVNVYWGTEYITPMLDILDKYAVKTTFFVGGTWVEKNPAVLKDIYSRGHEIGNHGYFHRDHKKINQKRNKEEIVACHNIVKEILGVDMNLFAPPSGSFSSNTLDIATELGYNTIMWSKDTIDWRDKDELLIFNRATKGVSGGDLILMHPTKETMGALERIIVEIKSKGLDITPVSMVL